MEQWKDVVGYEGKYRVSSYGRVYSLLTNKMRKLFDDKYGYKRVLLSNDGKLKLALVHRLLLIAFAPNPENKPCVNHKDGVKFNNKLPNLEWVTYKENAVHAVKNELHSVQFGENHYKSKLTNDDVINMRLEFSLGNTTTEELSSKYGIVASYVCELLRGEGWKHLL